MDKKELIATLDGAGVIDDIINFYNDDEGVETTMNNIGDAVHFVLEQLSISEEGDYDEAEESRLEGISLDNQRLMEAG